jgi:polar amino acid transport system substrate-binding protein
MSELVISRLATARLIILTIVLLGIVGNTQPAIAQTEPEPSNETTLIAPNLKSEIEKIKGKGKIIIAMLNKDNPPFFSQNKDGKLLGIDVDLSEAIAESLGVKVEFLRNSNTFDDVVEHVYRGEADLAISKLARSLPRAQKVLFSKPYLNFRQALLVNRLSLAKLQSKGETIDEMVKNFQDKIGVYAGSVYVQYARKTFPKATIVEFSNWQEAIDSVVSGKVTALFRDELEVRSIVLHKPELALQLRTVVLTDTSDTKGIATASGNHFLLDYTDLFLDSQYKQRDANQLLSAYTN